MALAAFAVKINQSLGDGKYDVAGSGLSDPSASAAPASATVAANIATLVTDGASPTQGHVNTLNTNWGTFLTSETAYRAAAATVVGGSDFTVILNTSKFTKMNQVQAAVKAFLQQAAASGKFVA